MAYTTPPSASPARPGTVSLASMLLWFLALLSLISAGLAIYQATLMSKDELVKIFTDGGYPQDQADAAATFAPVGVYIAAAFTLLFGILYLILALFVGKGKQWARITAWVVGGLSICCGSFSVLGSLGSGGGGFNFGTPENIDVEKVNDGIAGLMPSWLTPVSLVLGLISLLATIAVVILLALPPSHPFFRKPEPVWTPPTYPAS